MMILNLVKPIIALETFLLKRDIEQNNPKQVVRTTLYERCHDIKNGKTTW